MDLLTGLGFIGLRSVGLLVGARGLAESRFKGSGLGGLWLRVYWRRARGLENAICCTLTSQLIVDPETPNPTTDNAPKGQRLQNPWTEGPS